MGRVFKVLADWVVIPLGDTTDWCTMSEKQHSYFQDKKHLKEDGVCFGTFKKGAVRMWKDGSAAPLLTKTIRKTKSTNKLHTVKPGKNCSLKYSQIYTNPDIFRVHLTQ